MKPLTKTKGNIMKKFTVCAILACCAAVLCAGDIEIDNTLKNSKIGADKPLGWALNGNAKTLGKGQIIAGSEKGEKAFKIVTQKAGTSFYRLSPTPGKPGDKVKISAEIKGKGRATVGYYTYTGASNYFPAVKASKTFTLTDQFQDIEVEFVIQKGAKGQSSDNIRFFVRAEANSEAIFEDLEFEVDKKD